MNKNFKSSLILNQTNALILNSVESFKNSIQSTFWHKFIIHDGANLNSKQILKSIVQCGGDIFPIQYELDGENATFIARNCSKAIENLCARNLVLKYAEGKSPAILSIHVNKGVPNETTINIQDTITQVIRKRYTKETGVLNLENFVEDPDLHNKVYCAINQHKVLMFVLSLANELNVKCLRLNNNEISKIDGLEVMTYWNFKLLHSIDLRNNLIADISGLNLLQKFNITELWLDGNPVCNAYENYDYVLSVKKICPYIKILDGEELLKNGIPITRRNFLIKYSSLNLVDQFLEHYFTLYDTNRESLIDLYHSEALLSLTVSLIPYQITSTTKSLDEFERINRNLLKNKDSTKYEKCLYHSREDIVKILCKFSASEHDVQSFTVDILYHVDKTTVISVTGLFRNMKDKEKYDSKNVLNFSRTFVILATEDGEYHIINEQLFISNATTSQVKLAFQNYNEIKQKTFTEEEQSYLIETIVKICEIDVELAKRLLEITNWDMKSSIKIFIDQSIQQLMMSSSQSASSDSHYSWQNYNLIQKPFVEFSNPDPFIYASYPPTEIPYPSSGVIASTSVATSNLFSNPYNAAPHPPIKNTNASIEIPYLSSTIPYYPSLEISNSTDEILNSSRKFSNRFCISPQSAQITSTTNEFVSALSEDSVRGKQETIIENNSEKSQIVLVPTKDVICDVCYLLRGHEKHCTKHPNNLEKSVESNTNTSITQMYSFINKLEVESTKNHLSIGNASQGVCKRRKSRRRKCKKCNKRHLVTTICNTFNKNLNPVSPSTNSNIKNNINKHDKKNNSGNEKKLDEVSTKISYNADSSISLEESNDIKPIQPSYGPFGLHKKNEIILNLKSKNKNIEKVSKHISEATESIKKEKLSEDAITIKLENGSKTFQTNNENTDNIKTDPETKTNSKNTKLQQNNQEVLNLKSNDTNTETVLEGGSELVESTKTEKLSITDQADEQKTESSFKIPETTLKKNDFAKINIETKSTNINLKCWYCNKPNHDIFECRKRKKDIENGVFDFENFFETLKAQSYIPNTTLSKSIKIEQLSTMEDDEKQKSEKSDGIKTLEIEMNINNTGENLQSLCWYCNETKHDVADCEKRKRDIENNDFDFDKFFETLKSKNKCTSCTKEGHTKESLVCKLHPSNSLPPKCFYCKNKRHKLLDCEKRKSHIEDGIFNYVQFLERLKSFEANNNFKISNTTNRRVLLCDYCLSEGHTQSLCDNLKGDTTEILKKLKTLDPVHMNSSGILIENCSYCRKLGHSKYTCSIIRTEILVIASENLNSETMQRIFDTNTCSECKQTGHIKRHCNQFKQKLLNHIQRMILVTIPQVEY